MCKHSKDKRIKNVYTVVVLSPVRVREVCEGCIVIDCCQLESCVVLVTVLMRERYSIIIIVIGLLQ